MILVDWPMPENCAECPCLRHDSLEGVHAYQCNVTLKIKEDLDIKPEHCPLKEVHPETVTERVNHTVWKEKTVYVE